MTRLLLVFMVTIALTAEECDFDLGDLNQYVVSYELTVTNSSPVSLAVVTLTMPGVSRSATLGKGRQLAAIAFKGGAYTVTVGHLNLRLVQLKRRRDLLLDRIQTLNRPADIEAMSEEIKALKQVIATIQSGEGGAACRGTVKPGQRVTIVLSEQAGFWHC